MDFKKDCLPKIAMIEDLIKFLEDNKNVNDKSTLSSLVREKFGLVKDRSVFYCAYFAIRFSKSNPGSFSNTVLGLSVLQKYDDKPFIACLVMKNKNVVFLANSTFLKKISHTSQKLRIDNIKGSFNGSDIFKEFVGLENKPANFDDLFEIHRQIPFEANLERLVEATNGIAPTGKKFEVSVANKAVILDAPVRAKAFSESPEFKQLKGELDTLVGKYQNEILIASLIENVKIRGNIIEYLIAGKDEELKQNLIASLKDKTDVPMFKNDNDLGDYIKNFGDQYHTATDIKTKIMVLNSNPKAYDLDKILSFLSADHSIFMFYFVGIDFDKILNPVLVSMFHEKVLDNTVFIKHWAGRNSRGVSQLNGKKIKELFTDENTANIPVDKSIAFLNSIIDI